MKKIYSREQLQQKLSTLKARGKRVVFTNGCFDILHVGHVSYLAAARRLGDVLVLGLNSDSSVRKIKGEKRPLVPESERAEVLAALKCVDYVTIFDEETPLELIKCLQPDVLVKGGDWQENRIVGARNVRGRGGKVVVIPYLKGASTTNIIEKIRKNYS